jgi:K+-sensing histidine kinase KdpD
MELTVSARDTSADGSLAQANLRSHASEAGRHRSAADAQSFRRSPTPERSPAERAAWLELLSHELRTPVTSIHAAIAILRSRTRRADGVLRAELVEDIAEETERLFRTVEDVLVLAQLDADVPLGREPLLLQRVVPLLLSSERRRRPGISIELSESGPLPVVEGDEAGLGHVMRDLLAEAGVAPADPITVELRAPDDTGAEIHVIDDGPARPASFGLSRYASRRVMDAMGGRAWLRRRPDGRVERGLWLPSFGRMVDD